MLLKPSKLLFWETQKGSIGALLGIDRTNFLILGFSVLRPFWHLKRFKTTSKVVLELLLDVPEVLLEVLDLSWRSWRWFWASMY